MPQTPTRLISPYGSDRLVQLAARLRPALCDTLITVGGLEFPAHSLVLAGASPRLGCRGRWALVEDISPSTFAQILTFVYGESIELQPGELGDLEEAAKALGVQALEEACQRAQKGKDEDELDPGLKRHQQSEDFMRGSERGLGSPGEKQKPEKDFRSNGREQEMSHKHKAPGERPEMAGATRMMSSEEVMRGIESHKGSEESLRGCPDPLSPPGSLLTSLIPRPWWAEVPRLGEGQSALWSILLWPSRYGAPFSHSTPITAAWQVRPQDQRIPLTLNHSKALWSQNQLASSSPTPGSFPQGTETLSPWQIETSGQGFTGTLATCVSQERTLNCPSHQHPPLPSPARSRPYSCSVCGKRFSLKHQMETHYRVHTGMGILPSVNLSFSFPSPACQLLPCPIARRTPSLESLRPFLPSLAFSSTCRREALLL